MINKILLLFDFAIVALKPRADVITPTKRYYSSEVLDKAVETYKATVKKGRAVGELHPLHVGDNSRSTFEISLINVSHMIVRMWKWRGQYIALIRLVPKILGGAALKEMLTKYPDKVSFTLRGMASSHDNETLDGKYEVIHDDLRIIAWDASPYQPLGGEDE